MQLLTKDSNAKIKKTNKVTPAHYEFYNLTLTSRVIIKKDGSTFDPCPNANLFGCREDCLRESGRGIFSNVRLNTISDIDYLSIPCVRESITYKNIFMAYPELNFYDYTKIASRFGKKLPSNYYLTMSDSREPKAQKQIDYALQRGGNVATVFFVKKGQPLPTMHRGRRVIDGDIDDNRIEDDKNIVVGLRLKGNEAIKNVSNSNFVYMPA